MAAGSSRTEERVLHALLNDWQLPSGRAQALDWPRLCAWQRLPL